MESAATYTIAAKFGARALTLLTVSDHLKTGEVTTAEERQQTFSDMVEIALDTVIEDRLS
jgi:purine-nucleoside phosphorylase